MLVNRDIVESMSPLEVLSEFLDRALARDGDVCVTFVGEDGTGAKLKYNHEKKWFELKSDMESTDFPTVRAGLSAYCKTAEIGWSLLTFVRSPAQNVLIRVKGSKRVALEMWLRKLEEEGQFEFFVRQVVD